MFRKIKSFFENVFSIKSFFKQFIQILIRSFFFGIFIMLLWNNFFVTSVQFIEPITYLDGCGLYALFFLLMSKEETI